MADNPFEIPQALRDMSEQNLKQARAAYEQFTDFVTKTMGAWMGALPSNPMAAVVKDVQGRAMQIAKENAESVFTFAGKISNALTPQDIVTLQTQFTQDRMQAFVTQMQQLFSVIEESHPEVRTRRHGRLDGRAALNSHGRWLQGCTRPCRGNGEEECRVSFRSGRKGRQGTEFPGDRDTSDPFCSRPDSGLTPLRCRSFKG